MGEKQITVKSPMVTEKGAKRLSDLSLPSMEYMRTVSGMIDHITETRNLSTPAQIKDMIYKLGVLPYAKPKAEYVVNVGCYPPLISPGYTASYFRVLDKFGVDFTVLDDEVCCGFIAVEKAFLNNNQRELKLAKESAKGFLKENVDSAIKKGAGNIIHLCDWCLYMNRWAHLEGAFGEEGQRIGHLSYLEPIFGRLDKVNLKFKKPTVLGYYEGCFRRAKAIFPEVKIGWEPYRKLLGSIGNVKVVDFPDKCCMTGAESVIQHARKNKVDAIVVASCHACWLYLRLASKGTMQVNLLPEILEQALS